MEVASRPRPNRRWQRQIRLEEEDNKLTPGGLGGVKPVETDPCCGLQMRFSMGWSWVGSGFKLG